MKKLPLFTRIRRSIKAKVFETIRPLFVPNVDKNEDYICGQCGEPVLKRYLYCSDKCAAEADAELARILNGLLQVLVRS